MPATTRGFVYPAPTDAPDGPYSFQRLAETVQANLDTYTRTVYPLLTPPAGYSISGTVTTYKNPSGTRAEMSLAITRTGGSFAVTASATLTSLGTLIPSEARVAGLAQYRSGIFSGAGMNANAHVYLDIAGGIVQFRTQENITWGTNGTLYIYASWEVSV